MDRVWDASKYPFKPFVVLCQIKVIQGHVVKKGQMKNFEFGWYDACFWARFSSRKQKLTKEYFLNGLNRTKIENRKNAEILVKSGKSSLCGHSKWPNSTFLKKGT